MSSKSRIPKAPSKQIVDASGRPVMSPGEAIRMPSLPDMWKEVVMLKSHLMQVSNKLLSTLRAMEQRPDGSFIAFRVDIVNLARDLQMEQLKAQMMGMVMERMDGFILSELTKVTGVAYDLPGLAAQFSEEANGLLREMLEGTSQPGQEVGGNADEESGRVSDPVPAGNGKADVSGDQARTEPAVSGDVPRDQAAESAG